MDGAARRRIGENFGALTARIDALSHSQRVRLVCVTKYAELDWCAELVAAGAQELGENLLPQAGERFRALRAQGLAFTSHLLGVPQSRKLKLAASGDFDLLQALDDGEKAIALSVLLAERGATQDVLLQVSFEIAAHRHGVAQSELPGLLELLDGSCPQLTCRGLMLLPPGPESYSSAVEFESGTRGQFRQMRALFDRISAGRRDPRWDTLSMGMSQDYHWAIAEGATMVRVGSALFEGLEGLR